MSEEKSVQKTDPTGRTRITPVRFINEDREKLESVASHHQETHSGAIRMLVRKEFKRLENLAIRRAS
jgi:hypothetical protein